MIYDLTPEEYKRPLFAMGLLEKGEEMVEEVIKIEIKEK